MSEEAHAACVSDQPPSSSSNKRFEDRSEERSACVKRLKLSEPSISCAHTIALCEDEESAHCDLQILKSLQRLNPKHDTCQKYVEHRRRLVQLIFDLGELHFTLRARTIHRSINYLDRLLSKLQCIPHQSYNAFVAACVLVAGCSFVLLVA